MFLDRPLVFKSVLQVLKESLGKLLVSMKHDPRQNSWFELQHLNFTAEFKILHFFPSLKAILPLPFSFWTELFYLTLLAVHFQLALSNHTQVKPLNFQLDEQIFIHCFFLLLLMPEPVLYIWLRWELCTRYSVGASRQSPRNISNSTSYTAISRKFVGKSARVNRERYCGWFSVHCSSSNMSKRSASVSSGLRDTEKQVKARGHWPSAFIVSSTGGPSSFHVWNFWCSCFFVPLLLAVEHQNSANSPKTLQNGLRREQTTKNTTKQ